MFVHRLRHVPVQLDGVQGAGSGGLVTFRVRGRTLEQTVLRLRRWGHLDDDLHRTILRIQPRDGAVPFQVSTRLFFYIRVHPHLLFIRRLQLQWR